MTKAGNSQIMRTITLLITIFSLCLPAYAQYSGGTGVPNDPYQIATAEDLMLLGESPEDYDKHFILTDDIDLDLNLPGRKVFGKAVIAPHLSPGTSWTFEGTPFTGVFDGNGYTISHLTITGESYLGLFGRLEPGAQIQNLGVEAVDVNGTGDDVGGLVGENRGNIDTSYSSGSVNGKNSVGGLVGVNFASIVTSYSSGPVSGINSVGGLVGSNGVGGSVSSSYSIGSVSGTTNIGGLVGSGQPSSVTTSFWDIQTSSQSGSAGGVGLTTAEMMDTYMLGMNGFSNDPNWILDVGRDYPRLVWQETPGNVIAEVEIDWLDGEGTGDKPYRIDTSDQLILLGKASILWDKYFGLGADIDLDPALSSRQIFGQAVIPVFSGIFDGGDHVISNLFIRGHSGIGLFGYLTDEAKVRNIGIVDANITGSGVLVGGLVGYNGGSIATSYISGSISGTKGVGGLVGYNIGTITSSYSTGAVNGGDEVGGLVGLNDSGTITSSYSTGAVNGGDEVGGLVGRNFSGTITSCYSTGAVSGYDCVGGLVGYNWSTITSCYSTGAVNGGDEVGGLVGRNISGTITSSFWNTETSGKSTSKGGFGLTTTQMQDINIFLDSGWDFVNETAHGTCNFWVMQEGANPSLAVFSGFRPTEPNGSGTLDDPYVLTDANALGTVWYRPGAHYRLDLNIDLAGMVWNSAVVPGFGGHLDGNGHVIYHLQIEGGGHLGLFGYCLPETIISNLGLEAVDVDGLSYSVGGLTGENRGNISACYNRGLVRGRYGVGGLIGFNSGSITSSYSTGTVSGAYDYVGGLVGYNMGNITTSYAAGTVSGNGHVGGLVGVNNGDIATSFWDTQTSGQSSSAGGTGKTTAEMQTASTFLNAGWDFVNETANGTEDIWWILEGRRSHDYPRLWWELIPGN